MKKSLLLILGLPFYFLFSKQIPRKAELKLVSLDVGLGYVSIRPVSPGVFRCSPKKKTWCFQELACVANDYLKTAFLRLLRMSIVKV